MSSPSDNVEEEKAHPPKDRRFKLSRACDRCRRRRIRCDEGFPCHACQNSSASCTFEEPEKKTGHTVKVKRTVTLEERMLHLESLIKTMHHPTDNMAPPPGPALGVPPPTLTTMTITNPSNFFTRARSGTESGVAIPHVNPEQLAQQMSSMSLSGSYLYIDDEGNTRWQGASSGLPLLDSFVDFHTAPEMRDASIPLDKNNDWFPNRVERRIDVDPEGVWQLITSFIEPDLMDTLVRTYLSTTYYIMPFLHVPQFLQDYANPKQWGTPGFAAFIISVSCLASRHMDDPRVRADPADGVSAGMQYIELLGRLRISLPHAPTLYTIQSLLIQGVYACGLGKLSKAAALISEAVTTCIDAGLHRSADTYELFNPLEDELRKRTFWCVYIWDKQLSAHFGRPPMIRLRDCDVGEPSAVDDEFITTTAVGTQPHGVPSRLQAFICMIRLSVVLESVLDVSPTKHFSDDSPFLRRAATLLSPQRYNELRAEELLLDELRASIPVHWAHAPDTLASEDIIRVTQAERLYSAEQFVRLLIYRHRFSDRAAARAHTRQEEPGEVEREAMVSAQVCSMQIIAAHSNIALKGLMTFYGVHVIHQLAQAGRTLTAIILNSRSESLQVLVPPSLEALRSCVGLLRRFSGRYVCGQRSGDLLEEFCRLTRIPLNADSTDGPLPSSSRPPWLRPVRKKSPSSRGLSRSNPGDPPAIYTEFDPGSFSPSNFFSDGVDSTTSPTFDFSTVINPAAPVMQTGSPSSHHSLTGSHMPQNYDSPGLGSFYDGGGLDMQFFSHGNSGV